MGLACSSELPTVTVKDLMVGSTVGSTTTTTQKVSQYRHRSTSLFSTLTHLFSFAKVGVLTKDLALGD